MTREELKQEAIHYACNARDTMGKGYKRIDLRQAYLAAAKPREKRIAELEKENAELREYKDKYYSTLRRIYND